MNEMDPNPHKTIYQNVQVNITRTGIYRHVIANNWLKRIKPLM